MTSIDIMTSINIMTSIDTQIRTVFPKMYRRVLHEIEKLEEKYTCVIAIHTDNVKLTITNRSNYLFHITLSKIWPTVPPVIVIKCDEVDIITHTFLFDFYKSTHRATNTIVEYLELFMTKCDFQEPDVITDVTPDVIPDVTPDVIPDVIPDVTPDVIPDIIPYIDCLIIGCRPDEDKRNRRFFDINNVFLLDYQPERVDELEQRYFNIDFTDLSILDNFAINNQDRFSTICFDWSVWKFFITKQEIDDNDIARFNCLYNLLTPGGVLIIPNALNPSLITIPDNYRSADLDNIIAKGKQDYAIKIIKLLVQSEFKFKVVLSSEIKNYLFHIGPNAHPSMISENSTVDKYNVICYKI